MINNHNEQYKSILEITITICMSKHTTTSQAHAPLLMCIYL